MRKRSQGYDGAEPFLDEHICCSGLIHVRRRSIVKQEPVAFILRERSLEVDEPARHTCRPHRNQGATGHRRYVGSGAEAIIGLLHIEKDLDDNAKNSWKACAQDRAGSDTNNGQPNETHDGVRRIDQDRSEDGRQHAKQYGSEDSRENTSCHRFWS